MSGKALERVLGHATHLCMLRRELLSMFRSCYDFIQGSYNSRTRLWSSAAKEARWASHLMKLCTANLRRKWGQDVTASDASLSGVSVSRRSLTVEQQIPLGSQSDFGDTRQTLKSNLDSLPWGRYRRRQIPSATLTL